MVHGFWIIIIQLFEKSVWILIVAIFFLVSFLFWRFKKPRNNLFSDAVETVLTVFGVLIASTSHVPSTTKFSRQILISWSVFSFFISALFCNTIITRLMIPHVSFMVNSIKDIVQEEFLWGEPGYRNNSKRSVYFNTKDPWHIQLENRYHPLTRNNSTTALLSRRFVFPVQILAIDYVFINVDGLDTTKVEDYRIIKENLNVFYVSLAFSKKSPLLDLCFMTLQQFVEVGLVDHWKKDIILHYGSNQVKSLLYDSHAEALDPYKPLTFTNNFVAFKIILLGWCLSFLVFLLEIFVFNQSVCSKNHFLRATLKKEQFVHYYYD